jgi:hypothetical protein
MAMGKPTISTNFSGNLEFMNSANSWLIPATEVGVTGMEKSLYANHMKWGEPDPAGIRASLREAYQNSELREAKAKKAKEDIQRFSALEIGNLISSLLGA